MKHLFATPGRAALLVALAAGALWFLAGATWLSGTTQAPRSPAVEVSVDGDEIWPLLSAIALVWLAAAVLTVAAGSILRTVAGLAVIVSAGFLVGLVVTGAAAMDDAWREAISAAIPSNDAESTRHDSWYVTGTTILGVVTMVLGVLMVMRSRAWAPLNRRFERSAPTQIDDPWKAIDAGEDPTI